MPRTKKKSVCADKSTPVVREDSDSDTVDNLVTAKQTAKLKSMVISDCYH